MPGFSKEFMDKYGRQGSVTLADKKKDTSKPAAQPACTRQEEIAKLKAIAIDFSARIKILEEEEMMKYLPSTDMLTPKEVEFYSKAARHSPFRWSSWKQFGMKKRIYVYHLKNIMGKGLIVKNAETEKYECVKVRKDA
jgi:hypothetical protein